MQKTAKKGTNKTDLAKKQTKSAELNKANAEKAAKDVLSQRVTKYIYPADVKTMEDKKEFRRRMRAKISSYEKKLRELGRSKDKDAPSQLKELQKDYTNWQKENLTQIISKN